MTLNKWWRWQYDFVLLAGRTRRVLSVRQRRIQRLAMAAAKPTAGIDLIPGFSFGVWDWFQQTFLR